MTKIMVKLHLKKEIEYTYSYKKLHQIVPKAKT